MISCGSKFSLFLCDNQNPRSCGYNNYGQLGDGSTTDKTTAASIGTLTGISSVDCGGSHSLFLHSNGTVWSSGWNIGGSLGDGTTINRSNPVQVNISGVKAISAGRINSLFLKNDSTVWASGWNWYGSLGIGTTSMVTSPTLVSSLSGIIAVSAGGMPTIGDFSLFLKKDGTAWACGYNMYGSLGTGTTSTQDSVPKMISNLSGIKNISAGGLHSLFLKNDGTVWACGDNASGQLGITGYSVINVPMQIPSLTNIIAINAGYYHSLFLKGDGTVWACGSNFYGQLGDGTVSSSTVPVQVSSLTNIVAIAAGESHSLYLKNNGTVWATGSDGNGELGIGVIDNNPHPNAVLITSLCTVSSVKENTNEDVIITYPNPAITFLSVKITDEISIDSFIIMDVLGRKVLEQKENLSQINIQSLEEGMYQLLITSQGKNYMGKFIKE